jgi:hypothetical protein
MVEYRPICTARCLYKFPSVVPAVKNQLFSKGWQFLIWHRARFRIAIEMFIKNNPPLEGYFFVWHRSSRRTHNWAYILGGEKVPNKGTPPRAHMNEFFLRMTYDRNTRT